MVEPLSRDELAALARFTTPTVANAIEVFNLRPRTEGFMDSSVRCILPELGVMVGYAVTATIRASTPRPASAPSPLALYEEVLRYPEPRVVVIHDLDSPRPVGSYWGEVHASVFRGLGCAGTVTDGGVRDLDEVRGIGFHLFASCVLVSHAYVHLAEVGGQVRVGGLTVSPGDLVHGDQHGVLVIPHAIAREVPQAAAQVEQRERRIIEAARRPDFSPEKLAEARRGPETH